MYSNNFFGTMPRPDEADVTRALETPAKRGLLWQGKWKFSVALYYRSSHGFGNEEDGNSAFMRNEGAAHPHNRDIYKEDKHSIAVTSVHFKS